MDYTKQTPTEAGYYWNRRTLPGQGATVEACESLHYLLPPRRTGYITELCDGDPMNIKVDSFGPYWAGPILPPTTYTGPIGGGVALGIDPTDEDRHCLDNNDLH